MIEKITPEHIIGLDGLPTTIMPDSAKLMRKINELVDAVNEIMTWRFETDEDSDWYDDPKHREPPADPYAEQRRWIGKLCKFWDWDHRNLDHYAKLIDIREIKNGEMSNCPFKADDGTWYMYCEPVKPDSELIYHGE